MKPKKYDFLSLWLCGYGTREIASFRGCHESIVYQWLIAGKPPLFSIKPKHRRVTVRRKCRVPPHLEADYIILTRKGGYRAAEAAKLLGIPWT